jgi:segregation and condensation protein B
MAEARPEAILPGQRMAEAMSRPNPADRGESAESSPAELAHPAVQNAAAASPDDAGADRDPRESAPSLRAALEAVLLVVDEPVSEVALAQVVEQPRDKVAATLRELAAEYAAQGRGFDLREVAGGWRFYTRGEYAPVVERFVRDGQHARLTQAALETLAVVAYRQPVSRARVSAVRGVNVDSVMRTLATRGLVEEAGTEHETGAILYRTTPYFLERLGLRSLDDLPELAPFLPAVDDLDSSEITEGTSLGSVTPVGQSAPQSADVADAVASGAADADRSTAETRAQGADPARDTDAAETAAGKDE